MYAIYVDAKRMSHFSFRTSSLDQTVACNDVLSLLVELIRVPGDHGIEGNEKANEYAVIGSSLDQTATCNDVLTSLVVVGP